MPRRRREDAPYWTALRRFEREMLAGALRSAESAAAAALALGIDRTYLVRRCKQLGVPLVAGGRAAVGGSP